MHDEIIFSGFGGQGALFAGQLLAYAASDNGLHVTWIPSYGPEMRGGTAHCTVVVSDEPIGSPLVRRPSSVVALNLPSFEKYETLVKSGGLLVYNRSLVDRPQVRDDIRYVAVPANEIAEAVGQCAPGQRGAARRLSGGHRRPAAGCSRGRARQPLAGAATQFPGQQQSSFASRRSLRRAGVTYTLEEHKRGNALEESLCPTHGAHEPFGDS